MVLGGQRFDDRRHGDGVGLEVEIAIGFLVGGGHPDADVAHCGDAGEGDADVYADVGAGVEGAETVAEAEEGGEVEEVPD